ncbi:hypothetical protein GCM10025876_36920 [Demequina litorisediminis]|uniref:Excinuclease ABC subunit C n=1 Tax=Demequina litorisediminis TaxID=1849022 RepID=A0ABQ6ILA1_9MICO|nr:hypothetical protein GCM10025876_36920 [Demequina litorisediminis]
MVYVGKAKNLRARLANYFQPLANLHPRTQMMVTTAASVEWTVVRNEVESLILEHTWIKEYDPRFNVVFKDDKSYPYLAVTLNEKFPRIQVMRGDRKKGVRYFGPYAKAWAIRETVDTLLAALPVRTCAPGVFRKAERQGRPCLLGYIDKCSAPCVGRISPEDHRALAERVCAVLGGDAKGIMRDLTHTMNDAAEREDFEAAARARDRLQALTAVLDRNAVVLDAGVDVDIFSLVDDEMEAAAHVFYVRDGRITGERGWVVDKPEPLGAAAMVLQPGPGGLRRRGGGRHSPRGARACVAGRRGAARRGPGRHARHQGRYPGAATGQEGGTSADGSPERPAGARSAPAEARQ